MRSSNQSFFLIGLLLQIFVGAGCEGQAESPEKSRPSFSQQIQRFSEPGGYFDTDNLISNESSYLHVINQLDDLKVKGGAYLGVGPDQNFSYIAQIQPEIVFLIDIRRDNMLQHLMFKAIFHFSSNRLAFLCHLLGRSVPDDSADWNKRSIQEILQYIDQAQVIQNPDTDRLLTYIESLHIKLSDKDAETIRRFHRTFFSAGLDLKFTSHNRGPLSEYPTYRDLILETDRGGNQANYLVTEMSYQFVSALQEKDLIIPVVGDLAGTQALKTIAAYLQEEHIEVSAFYTSNVEFYLAGENVMPGFVDNLKALPVMNNGVIIRSYFNRWAYHSLSVAGYASTQMIQRIHQLIDGYDAGDLRRYDQIVQDFEPIK